MPDETTDGLTKDERALRIMAILFGSTSVIAWPSAIVYPPAMLLMFSIPMALATAGRLHGSRGWQQIALVVAVVLLAGVAAGSAAVVTFVMTVGPIPVAFLVGRLLRRFDHLAGFVWLVTAALAYSIGVLLVGAMPTVAHGVALVLIAFGFVFAVLRVRRRPQGSV